jgi:hypothetical protein
MGNLKKRKECIIFQKALKKGKGNIDFRNRIKGIRNSEI